MKAILIGALFAFICWNCNSKEQNLRKELNKENLVQLKLNNLNISLKVPRPHHFFETNDKSSFNINPHGRGTKQFSISNSKSSVTKEKYEKSFSFDNGGILYYNALVVSAGSGGNEFQLVGVLKFADEILQVTSSIQKDSASGETEFCLKYLSTIQSLKNLPTNNIPH